MLTRFSITGQFTLLCCIGVVITPIAIALGLSTIYNVALQSRRLRKLGENC
jgi:hypothetical protein